MKILAIETSTEFCSVALWRDGVVDEAIEHAGQRHSELLLPMVDDLLGRHGLAPRDLDGIAYGAGPGSFTGLRIGCGVAQGLAFGAGLRMAGVGTLEAMAAAVDATQVVCCLDARMGEIYHAAYSGSGAKRETVCSPGLWAPAEAPALPAGPWTGCGNGFSAYGPVLERRYTGRLSSIMPEVYPRARHVAALAARDFAAGSTLSPEQAAPVYIRDKVALKTAER